MLITLTNGNKYYTNYVCRTLKRLYICLGETKQEYLAVDNDEVFSIDLLV